MYILNQFIFRFSSMEPISSPAASSDDSIYLEACDIIDVMTSNDPKHLKYLFGS